LVKETRFKVVERNMGRVRHLLESSRKRHYRLAAIIPSPYRANVSLLFTDVIMPDSNGKQLADEALRRRPRLKVLFTTGYTANAIVHGGVLDSGVHFMSKPFTLERLAAKVRLVLDD
jgi:DNA-binding NtrC family response regulator